MATQFFWRGTWATCLICSDWQRIRILTNRKFGDSRNVGTQFLLTRVLGHLLDVFRLTPHRYIYESAFLRFTLGEDAIFFWRGFKATCLICWDWKHINIFTNRQCWDSRKVRTQFFLTRVLGHLLDKFRLTVHTYTYGSAIQRFTQDGDAIFFDARSGPPASFVQIDHPYVYLWIGYSEIHYLSSSLCLFCFLILFGSTIFVFMAFHIIVAPLSISFLQFFDPSLGSYECLSSCTILFIYFEYSWICVFLNSSSFMSRSKRYGLKTSKT